MSSTPPEGTPISSMAPGLKAGVKTTEFWVSVAAIAIAAVLLYKGKDELAAFVTGAVGITYPSVRSMAKKAAVTALKGVGVMVLLLSLAGCCVGHIRAASIAPTFKRIRARHDAAVKVAKYASEVQRDADLVDTEVLDYAIDEAVASESR